MHTAQPPGRHVLPVQCCIQRAAGAGVRSSCSLLVCWCAHQPVGGRDGRWWILRSPQHLITSTSLCRHYAGPWGDWEHCELALCRNFDDTWQHLAEFFLTLGGTWQKFSMTLCDTRKWQMLAHSMIGMAQLSHGAVHGAAHHDQQSSFWVLVHQTTCLMLVYASDHDSFSVIATAHPASTTINNPG